MRRDLDSITEKGHAVVRLNQSLMAQVKSLREGNHQQNSNGSGVNEHQRHAGFEGHASGHNGFGNGAVVGDMMTVRSTIPMPAPAPTLFGPGS